MLTKTSYRPPSLIVKPFFIVDIYYTYGQLTGNTIGGNMQDQASEDPCCIFIILWDIKTIDESIGQEGFIEW
jgi:hypothetical protein